MMNMECGVLTKCKGQELQKEKGRLQEPMFSTAWVPDVVD